MVMIEFYSLAERIKSSERQITIFTCFFYRVIRNWIKYVVSFNSTTPFYENVYHYHVPTPTYLLNKAVRVSYFFRNNAGEL